MIEALVHRTVPHGTRQSQRNAKCIETNNRLQAFYEQKSTMKEPAQWVKNLAKTLEKD